MNEFVTVSSSSYDPASLATKLTEKAADGWTVVAIVPTGGDVTAFLSREGGAGQPAMTDAVAEPAVAAMTPEPAPEPAVQATTPAAAEPAGWAVAPEPAPVSSAPATVIAGIGDYASASSSPAAQAPAAQTAPAAYQPAAAAAPAVPAGWYADPAGRFELRYWDGGTWTEHVSRAGQQFTDAPVA
jgi:hypothetical protein